MALDPPYPKYIQDPSDIKEQFMRCVWDHSGWYTGLYIFEVYYKKYNMWICVFNFKIDFYAFILLNCSFCVYLWVFSFLTK
jgi:hypothetical protein